MNLEVQILEIIRAISNSHNPTLIGKIRKLIDDSPENEFIGFEPDGSPITQQNLIESIQESESDIKNGKTWTGNDLLDHFKNQSQDG